MPELHGITVIRDDAPDQQSTDLGIGITAVVRIKHAALHEAAKVVGSASALARHLGISATEICKWINLKYCPPKEAARGWTEERIAATEAKLYQLTGKTWEELWPDVLRQNHEFLNAPKSMEKVYNWKEAAMLSYASATRERLLKYTEPERGKELQIEAIERNLHMLTKTERIIINGLFGLGGEEVKTTRTLAKELGTKSHNISAWRDKALSRLQHYASLSLAKIEGSQLLPATGKEPISFLQLPAYMEIYFREMGFETVEDLVNSSERELQMLKINQNWIAGIRLKLKDIGIELLKLPK